MATLNRLVAATDLSAPARHAVERAASVSQATGAQLDLVHVATPAPIERLRRLAGQIPSDLEKRMLDAPHNAMQELAKAVARRHGVTAQVHVASGSLLAELRQMSSWVAGSICGRPRAGPPPICFRAAPSSDSCAIVPITSSSAASECRPMCRRAGWTTSRRT